VLGTATWQKSFRGRRGARELDGAHVQRVGSLPGVVPGTGWIVATSAVPVEGRCWASVNFLVIVGWDAHASVIE
jgi:hypothetical protein